MIFFKLKKKKKTKNQNMHKYQENRWDPLELL